MGNTEENEIPYKAMVMPDLDWIKGEQWLMLCSISDRVGHVQANPLLSEIYWEAPMPLNSLHPRSNIQVRDWVLDKAKEIQHCVGTLYNCFKDQFIALIAA